MSNHQTALSPGTHTVDLGNVAQRYHVAGSGPVVLAHPGGPGLSWEYLRMPAAESHVTMVYVEPIGTGASGRLPAHPHGYTRERYAQALDGLIDHLGADRVHLLGHSHGGFVAQHYALTRPDRLAGVILYDSAPVTGPEHYAEAARNMEEFARRNAGRPGLDGVLATWESLGALADDEGTTRAARGILPAYLADYWDHQERYAPLFAITGTYISGLDDRLAPDLVDDRDALGSIRAPALVVAGRHDVICGPRWAGELAAGIPRADLVVLENSGHLGHVEEPDAFARAVTTFVSATAR
ncbi:pimeloyl-ACP methyl ester carboxylesterase [Nonomuraea thailandensis]|uniref:Pimeloyl-ACP methyl ester carboxylesterase n=1 Tax=Nonomuraea thailandensis TaxID=1188745 RepID=A0A9X2GJ68_9ACTN|nr:alpha/beta hydrolase [Nonomuraea thailandensis]MCP2360089.1 pimeloyl-ACP methyl ester carboxylesterase [Nonomuraea thailandensis]